MAGTRNATKRKVEDAPKAVKAKKTKATKPEPVAPVEQVDGVVEPSAAAVDTKVPEKQSSGPTLIVEARCVSLSCGVHVTTCYCVVVNM